MRILPPRWVWWWCPGWLADEQAGGKRTRIFSFFLTLFKHRKDKTKSFPLILISFFCGAHRRRKKTRWKRGMCVCMLSFYVHTYGSFTDSRASPWDELNIIPRRFPHVCRSYVKLYLILLVLVFFCCCWLFCALPSNGDMEILRHEQKKYLILPPPYKPPSRIK